MKVIFQFNLLQDTPCKHPIVVLKEFTAPVMKNILQYLYMGKVVLSEHEISSFMDAADFFGICGVIPDTYSCDVSILISICLL